MSNMRPDRSRGDRGGEPLPPGVAEAPGGEFYFRPGVLLVLEEELERREGLRAFLTERGRLGERAERGVWTLRVDDALETLDAVERRYGPDAGVEPDYVFVGSQTLKGGPWDEVEPATAPSPEWQSSKTVGDGMTIAVLDTGIAFEPIVHPWLDQRFTADPKLDRDVPNDDGGAFLAHEGGHGTFVAGIASRVAPAAHLVVIRVLDAAGVGSSSDLLRGLARAEAVATERTGRCLDVVNLSLGGYTRHDRAPRVLWTVIRSFVAQGTVVVAAAGNFGSARPFWPAALPEVIGVGALEGWGPAPFSNYGPWVDACAPGVDVVSTFFDERSRQLQGADLPPSADGAGPVRVTFPGYGRWSGTSFAAPKVAGAIAATATVWGISAAEAADRLVRDWRLYRVPDLGVVVNVS
jgi:subtilisin family serine protease